MHTLVICDEGEDMPRPKSGQHCMDMFKNDTGTVMSDITRLCIGKEALVFYGKYLVAEQVLTGV